MVSHTGIEPVTPWLKVMCSTDWANGSYGAGDEGRTRDIQLGRLTLYQLSYSRIIWYLIVNVFIGCGGWIWTNDLRVMSPTSYRTALPRANLIGNLKFNEWCLGPDLNRHGIKYHRILSPVRLPISPPRHNINIFENLHWQGRLYIFL